jgi:tetratricopeptide (TPR) repeat protein
MKSTMLIAVITSVYALAGCTSDGGTTRAADAEQTTARIAPLLEGMGDHHHPVTTPVALAQRYFDQGLILAFGFNHAEAARSFREAQRLDPDCAMAYWGEALVLGPNINAPMESSNVPIAWAALQKAISLSSGVSEAERRYIDALSKRYQETPPDDRSGLDRAYADAMRDLARELSNDADAQTLFAESLMDTTPWDYWLEDGEPKPVTREILASLERALATDPDHAGANHFYIHAVEAIRPEDGAEAADRLGGVVPGAGHLVHMPAHIYIRLGRYSDASDANERAIASDDEYVTQCHAQGLYPEAYMPHNHHFLWYATAMEGRSERSIEAAEHIRDNVDLKMINEPGYGVLQHFYAMPLYAFTRFGKWEAILAQEEPAVGVVYPTAVWHYARGMALARMGRLSEADSELDALTAMIDDPSLEGVLFFVNSARDILRIAGKSLGGEIAAERGQLEQALALLREAVQIEDALTYDEPPPWHTPTRQSLGAVLLAADQSEAAERVYREDLDKYLENPWSLFGLRQALDAQGRVQESAAVQRRFEKAWTRADFSLEASRF